MSELARFVVFWLAPTVVFTVAAILVIRWWIVGEP